MTFDKSIAYKQKPVTDQKSIHNVNTSFGNSLKGVSLIFWTSTCLTLALAQQTIQENSSKRQIKPSSLHTNRAIETNILKLRLKYSSRIGFYFKLEEKNHAMAFILSFHQSMNEVDEIGQVCRIKVSYLFSAFRTNQEQKYEQISGINS